MCVAITVAILAQGTHWAVADLQALFNPHTLHTRGIAWALVARTRHNYGDAKPKPQIASRKS